MKQQVNPVVTAVCVVVVLVILIFFGMRALSPPAPSGGNTAPAAANKPAMINGHPVPNNVPYQYYTEHMGNGQGQPGGQGQMPGGAPNQMPTHP